jgi:hypothetical protein
MQVEALARELVAFDARISEEVAEHLIARAQRLEDLADRDALTAAARAGRFRTLAALIQRELGFDELPAEHNPKVTRLPAPVEAAAN